MTDWKEPYFDLPANDAVPRLVVIDGCNIARSSCGPGRDNVNCAGLVAVIRWLMVRGFEVVAFLPVIYNNNHNFNAAHVHLLQKLEEMRVITFTPARSGRGDRRAFINYDDLYVAGLAERHGGVVLSGDRFKDILRQPQYSGLHNVLRDRRLDVRFHRLAFDFVHCGPDKFFKSIPELCLKVSAHSDTSVIIKKLFAHPADSDYSKALHRRQNWSEEKSQEQIRKIDDLMDELCERMGTRPETVPLPCSQWIRGNVSQGDVTRPAEESTEDIVSDVSAQFSVETDSSEPLDDSWTGEGDGDQTRRGRIPSWTDIDILSVSVDQLNHMLNNPNTLTKTAEEAQQDPPQAFDWSLWEGDAVVVEPINNEPPEPMRVDEVPVEEATEQVELEAGSTDVVSPAAPEDNQVLSILSVLFPAEVVELVLRDNVSRNVEVLANICAEMIAH